MDVIIDATKNESNRYSLGEFHALNHGQVKLPLSLTNIFEHYKMPTCCLRYPHINPHNVEFSKSHLNSNGKSGHIRRPVVNQVGDDKIIADIRSAFSSVTTKKDGSILCTAQINQMILPDSSANAISDLFFSTMIQSPRMIMPYLSVLFNIQRNDKLGNKIRLGFFRKVLETFNNPVVLESNKIMDGSIRTKQHRQTTCLMLASLYAYQYNDELKGPKKQFDDYTKLMSKLVNPLINCINNGKSLDDSHDHIGFLAECISVLVKSNKFPNLLNSISSELQGIFNNKKYKLTKKLPLRQFV